MRALVTGGGGFLGGAVVDALLARGDEVVSIARGDYPALAARGVSVRRADLADPAAGAVLHDAARGAARWFPTAPPRPASGDRPPTTGAATST